MSVSVTISGEIIESQTYLSNYFVTLTGDQTIYGSNTFNQSLNVKSLNFNTGQINASTLDISSNTLTFTGNSGTPNQILTSNGNHPVWQNFQTVQDILFGTEVVEPTLTNGIIYFGKEFNLEPYVTITQYSNRIVPLCITNVTTTNFQWAAASSNIGKIMWSAGPKFPYMN